MLAVVQVSLTSCGLLLCSPKTLCGLRAHRAQIHACSLMCFALGFYEALLGLLNRVNLQCHLEAFEYMMILCSL